MNVSDESANYQSHSQRGTVKWAWVFAGRACGTPGQPGARTSLRVFCTERSERDAFRARAAIGYSPRLGCLDFSDDAALPIPWHRRVPSLGQCGSRRSAHSGRWLVQIKVKVARFW